MIEATEKKLLRTLAGYILKNQIKNTMARNKLYIFDSIIEFRIIHFNLLFMLREWNHKAFQNS
jgi:hypothetical protein